MKKLFILLVLGLLNCAVSFGADEAGSLQAKAFEPQGVASLEEFKKIAILEEGRLKPLDTYAQNILLQFSGKRTFAHKPAIKWMAKLLFSPESTRNDQIFLINNPEIATALGVEPQEHRRYSYNQLEPGLEKLTQLAKAAFKIEDKERSLVENELLRVHNNIGLYVDISRSFSFAFPHPDFTINSPELAQEIDLPASIKQFSFLDIALKAEPLYALSKSLDKKNRDQWSAQESDLMKLMMNLYQWSSRYSELPFSIIPAYEEGQSEHWLSPWDAMGAGLRTTEGREELSALQDMVVAYWLGQQLEFDLAAKTFSRDVGKRAPAVTRTALGKIPLELLYNNLNLFLWAKILYGLTFLLFLFSLIQDRKILHTISFGMIGTGFLLHLTAVAMRMAILSRPPVSTLYETFIFVGLIGVLLGLIIERVNREWLGILISSICGFCLLMLASKFSAEGDTLKMLVAVLNSNFWLSTHVLSITTGYAGCSVAGVVGHIYILQALARPKDTKRLETIYRNLIGILGFGLIMTFLGTNLGGIWADQSWGRFWGWDPKENGALLIVIWCVIIFHARLGKMISALGVATFSVLGMIVVMWAWFGVNLLSVGLHSYGFTQGTVVGLAIYLAVEILFLLISVPILLRKGSKF